MSIENDPEHAGDYLAWLESQDLISGPTVEEIVALEMKSKFDATREIRLAEYKDRFVRTTTITGESYVYNPISAIESGVLFVRKRVYSDLVDFKLVKGSVLLSHEDWQANSELSRFYIETAAKVTDAQPRQFEIDGMYSCVATFGSFVEMGYLASHTACLPEDVKRNFDKKLMDPAYTIDLVIPFNGKNATICVDRRLSIEPDKIVLAEVV